MGQQQILLVILVTVLVGIATFVAINTMQSTHDDATTDAIRQDILQATSVAITYYRRNSQTGGGGGSFINIQLRDIMLPASNDNARYEISDRTIDSFRIIATPHTDNANMVAVVNVNGVVWE